MSEIHDTNGSLLCCACGATDIVAVKPGTEGEELLGIILDRGEPTQVWCAACAPWWREPKECAA